MSLFSIYQLAKNGDEESIAILCNKFQPLIMKYSRNLNYEMAKTDIIIRFLEFIKNTDFEVLNLKCDGAVMNYTKIFFKNTFINLLKAKKHSENFIYLDDESSFIQDVPCYDDQINLEGVYFSYLTDLQKKVIIDEYIYGYSEKEIADKLHISRQAVNRAKNRGIKIIEDIYYNS